MTKQELQQTIKQDIEYHMDEFSLSYEEAREEAKNNYVLNYVGSKMSEEDFLALMEEMGYVVEDMEALRQDRDKKAKKRQNSGHLYIAKQ